MNFSKLYEKLPKKIQNSERLLQYFMRISKFFHKHSNSKQEVNNMFNFIFNCTDIKTTGTLRDIQLVYLELLRLIDNVCEKYGLEYFLAYGTLLGAVRHQGFIPWDDDCDIIMMRNDYNKLIEVLPEEINKNDFLKENIALTRLININDNFFDEFNSIYDNGHGDYFVESGLNKSLFLQIGLIKPFVKLDIFPFDYIKEDSIDYYSKNFLAHKFYFRKLYYNKDFSFDKEFNERFEKLGLTLNETDFIAEGIDASYFDDFGVYNKECFFPLKTIKFENYEFKCPNKVDELLKFWYGEYMNIPNDIWIHNYSQYNRSLFKSETEMNDAFKSSIQSLKEINDNFG